MGEALLAHVDADVGDSRARVGVLEEHQIAGLQVALGPHVPPEREHLLGGARQLDSVGFAEDRPRKGRTVHPGAGRAAPSVGDAEIVVHHPQ